MHATIHTLTANPLRSLRHSVVTVFYNTFCHKVLTTTPATVIRCARLRAVLIPQFLPALPFLLLLQVKTIRCHRCVGARLTSVHMRPAQRTVELDTSMKAAGLFAPHTIVHVCDSHRFQK